MPAKKLLGESGGGAPSEKSHILVWFRWGKYIQNIYKTEEVYVTSCTKFKIFPYLTGGVIIKRSNVQNSKGDLKIMLLRFAKIDWKTKKCSDIRVHEEKQTRHGKNWLVLNISN